MKGNYIKINRSILEWEWYQNINTCRVFMHMLLKANWKDAKFQGKDIPIGSFVSSYAKLADECNLTINEVRTAIKHLILTKEITSKSHGKYTVFTIKNYCEYQEINKVNHNQNTNNSQPINEQLTTIEEEKKERKEKININNKRFSPPSVEEVIAYCLERKNKVDAQSFVDFYSSKDWMIGKNKMKDWKAAVRTWERSSQTRQEETAKRGNKFNNFEGRKYDMQSLEAQLLG